MLLLSMLKVLIITVWLDYYKSKAIHLLESFVFHDRGHIQNVYQRNSY